jgi:zinc/manganese transport system permease protein
VLSGVAGLLVSYHLNLPSGPAIVLTCGAVYLLSVAAGPRESLWRRFVPARHLEA